MSFDVYFKEDVLNILRSTYAASEGSASLVLEMLEDPDLKEVPIAKLLNIYRRGFATALGAVGLAFGLDTYQREKAAQQAGTLLQSSTDALQVCHSRPMEPFEADLIYFLFMTAQYEKRK